MSRSRVWVGAAVTAGVVLLAQQPGAARNPAPAAGTPHEEVATPRTFILKGAYHDGLVGKVCSAGKPRDIAGFEPSGSGKAPVFVYLTGTTMKFNGADAQKLTQEMARRGFLAATVEYDNAGYPYCEEMMQKASCVWGKPSSKSALTKLCEHPRADCDGSIVVSGFSQGANLASVAKNYDGRVKGAYLLGHGHKATNIRVTPCMQDSATQLTAQEMRSVNAETDFFFGRTPVRVRKQLQEVTGATCDANALDCEVEGGGGWHIVQAKDLADGKADHCYFLHEADVYCAKFDGFDPGWEKGSKPWSMGPSLDWLASRAKDES